MAFSLPSDVMGSRQKLQLAMQAYRRDTSCIEMPAEWHPFRREALKTIAHYSAGQQKAPDCSGAIRRSRIYFRAMRAPPARDQYR